MKKERRTEVKGGKNENMWNLYEYLKLKKTT